MSIEIIKPGLQTSIQDIGRFGLMHLGIAHSGSMDPLALRMANHLVSQPSNNPVIEFTQTGPDILFNTDVQIAITGAKCSYRLNDKEIAQYRTISVRAGERLKFNKMQQGFRGYIAFAGQLDIEKQMGSSSTHLMAQLGGFKGRALLAGDTIKLNNIVRAEEKSVRNNFIPNFTGNYRVRVTAAPETAEFSQQQIKQFLNNRYNVSSELNRMGIRLTGDVLKITPYPEMLSRGLLPGAIQIPANGLPIICGMDAQTVGGYLRIGQIIKADMPIIAQCKPNDKIQFSLIDTAEAKNILKHQSKYTPFSIGL